VCPRRDGAVGLPWWLDTPGMFLQIWITHTLAEAKLPDFAVLESLSYSYRHQPSALRARWKLVNGLVLFGSGGKQKSSCSISSCYFSGINVCA